MKFCMYCGEALEDDAIFCHKCGKQIDDHDKEVVDECPGCGAILPITHSASVKCAYCGRVIVVDEDAMKYKRMSQTKMEVRKEQMQDHLETIFDQNTRVDPKGKAKNKWVSFILCFFLGFYGAHKFYEGKIGMGILYVFTAGLCFFGWFLDIILILLKPNPYYVD